MSIDLASKYTIVDSLGALIYAYAPPYKRTFKPVASGWEYIDLKESAFLLFWVKTGYTDNSEAASVRIDGKEIGKIYPRPWLVHQILDLEADIIVFDSNLIRPKVGFNELDHTLEIVPSGKSYLIVGVVLCGFRVDY